MNCRLRGALFCSVIVLMCIAFVDQLAAQGSVKGKQRSKKPTPALKATVPADTSSRTGDQRKPAAPPTQAADTTHKPPPPPSFEYRTVDNHAFNVGERLTFDVSYGFITAGEAVMAIPSYDDITGRRCYRVEFTVNSLSSFNWIYKVDDHYLTFIDIQSIAPLRFEQHVREGSYSRDFAADFDQVNHIAKTTEGQHPIPPYVLDIMSAFYYFRTLNLSATKTGDVFTLNNFYKDTTYELGVRVLGRQELEVTAGTFKTLVVEPLVKEGGLFKSEGRIVIWLSDDDLKIPVRVNTKVVIGSIDTELSAYSGLCGPLRSRIK